ncbi:phosphoribosyltransferase [Fastidiosibacter lacustris]|uniref:phosphoribosyltransferase n=1 Tax=Fastidiosibacter lacustris TaxID=2056695 RepID=UPI000E355F7A|nr:phosphoribosyltransferase [Fastidiosibacter lacustris]
MRVFKNRADAGQQLAEKLLSYQNKKDVLVLALPRGGVPVAFEIANILHVPMSVVLVRKLGIPGQEELAMGAVSEGNVRILNQELIQHLNISEKQIQHVLQKEQQELARRLQRYRQGKPLLKLNNKTIILVDDGIATGATFKAAIQALKTSNPKKLVIATPVASHSSFQEITSLVDESVCLVTPEPFYGVGQWYQRFDQISDEEVLNLLQTSPVKFDHLEQK